LKGLEEYRHASVRYWKKRRFKGGAKNETAEGRALQGDHSEYLGGELRRRGVELP